MEKKEEKYHQMWRLDFQAIYNTLESQTIFVRGTPTQNNPDWGQFTAPPAGLPNYFPV